MQRIAGSPWAVLGLEEGASLDEVVHAFRVAAKQTHPDRGGDRAAFEAVRAAFDAVRPHAPRRCAKPAARNPYAWCDQPLPPRPAPTFQPPRSPHPRPRPRSRTAADTADTAGAFASVLASFLTVAA